MTTPKPTDEETLRDELRSVTQSLKRREPLDPTYRRLLLRGVVGSTNPVLPNDPLYKRVPSNLRGCVESFLQQTVGKDPFDRISQRQPLDDEQMRTAFNLREEKEHEQKTLLDATLAQFPRRFGMDVSTRRKHMKGVAAGLQMDPRQSRAAAQKSGAAIEKTNLAAQTEQARLNAERERQAAQSKARETARLNRMQEEKAAQLAHQKKSAPETPAQAQGRALHKLYYPMIFRKLWDMEFPQLNNANPFRVVIDRNNFETIAPNYFDMIKTPMNLTYIKQKADKFEYKSLQDFFEDVQLMIQNALTYNSDPSSPYRAAAKEMRKEYGKLRKEIIELIQRSKNKS